MQFSQVDQEITEDLLFGTKEYEEPDTNVKGSSGTDTAKNVEK